MITEAQARDYAARWSDTNKPLTRTQREELLAWARQRLAEGWRT